VLDVRAVAKGDLLQSPHRIVLVEGGGLPFAVAEALQVVAGGSGDLRPGIVGVGLVPQQLIGHLGNPVPVVILIQNRISFRVDDHRQVAVTIVKFAGYRIKRIGDARHPVHAWLFWGRVSTYYTIHCVLALYRVET